MAGQADQQGSDIGMPLYVDLDGTLVRTDVAQELLVGAMRAPGALPGILRAGWTHGASGIKRATWSEERFFPELLPYDDEVLAYLRQARSEGRRLVLATAADRRVAEAVAGFLGLFDAILASDPGRNLKGAAKLDAIRADSGGAAFEYLGDSPADIPIWQAAARAGFVAPKGAARVMARDAGTEATLATAPPPPLWRGLWKAMRPHQWAKNVLILLPLFFAHLYTDPGALAAVLVGFVAMSLMASAVYIFNDLLDIPADRRHRTKRHRPFAAGLVQPVHGVGAGLGCLGAALGLGFGGVGLAFGVILEIYFIMTTAYSFVLKRFSTIDVIVLSLLYIVRIVAGAAACEITLSPWLLTFALFFFVSLAYMKRFIELESVEEDAKLPSRNYWGAEMASIQIFGIASAAVALLTLAQYMNTPIARETYGARDILWLAVPVMMFWIYRTWLWAIRGKVGDDPVVFALTDRVSQLTLLTLLAIFLSARYFEFAGFIH